MKGLTLKKSLVELEIAPELLEKFRLLAEKRDMTVEECIIKLASKMLVSSEKLSSTETSDGYYETYPMIMLSEKDRKELEEVDDDVYLEDAVTIILIPHDDLVHSDDEFHKGLYPDSIAYADLVGASECSFYKGYFRGVYCGIGIIYR